MKINCFDNKCGWPGSSLKRSEKLGLSKKTKRSEKLDCVCLSSLSCEVWSDNYMDFTWVVRSCCVKSSYLCNTHEKIQINKSVKALWNFEVIWQFIAVVISN